MVERIFTNLSPEDQEEIDAAVAQVSEAMENDAFDAAWAAGSGMSVDEVVEFALGVRAIEPR